MTMNETNVDQAEQTHDETPARSPQDIAELFEIAGSEGKAIRELSGCVARLSRVQAAKEALQALSPAEVREALISRHHRQLGQSLGERT
jgi:hypothetical protein